MSLTIESERKIEIQEQWDTLEALPDPSSRNLAIEKLTKLAYVILSLGTVNCINSVLGGITDEAPFVMTGAMAAAIVCKIAKDNLVGYSTNKVNQLAIYLIFIASMNLLVAEPRLMPVASLVGAALCAATHHIDSKRPGPEQEKARILLIGEGWLEQAEVYNDLDPQEKQKYKDRCQHSNNEGDRQFYHKILSNWTHYRDATDKIQKMMVERGAIKGVRAPVRREELGLVRIPPRDIMPQYRF